MARSSATKTDGTTAAEDRLAAQEPQDNTSKLQEQVKEERAQRDEELKAGAKQPAGVEQELIDNQNVAGARSSAGFNGSGAQSGFMDQLSRASAADALEGHFVKIDLNAKGVEDGFVAAGLGEHRGDYGVYLTPGALDQETGRPVTAVVRLRDDTNATLTVPYEALSPAAAGGR